MQATRTKAIYDTVNIKNDTVRNHTVTSINQIGKHLVCELRVPKND